MAKRPAAGELNKKVTIYTLDESSTDSAGQPVVAWTLLKEVHASIDPLQGREAVEAQQKFGEVTHKLTVRHLSGIGGKCKAVFGSRTFYVEAVLNLGEEDKRLTLMCKERS